MNLRNHYAVRVEVYESATHMRSQLNDLAQAMNRPMLAMPTNRLPF